MTFPPVSIVVCVYNGESTLGRCLDSVSALAYPDYEVIVVDDGSTDKTNAIAKAYLNQKHFKLISLPKNQGLSAARNYGLEASRGEVIAYLDSDAFAPKHWLQHLVNHFLKTSDVAVGGPNLLPLDANTVAKAVDKAPGSPTPVLISASKADHLPGCNLALRKSYLAAIKGFDSQFWVAGDDVDLCWRIKNYNGTLGFVPEAFVWHCRRDTIKGYFKQQRGYGRAEALLSQKWPEKFNFLGHVSFPEEESVLQTKASSSLYGYGLPFFELLPQIPEWNLVIALTFMFSILAIPTKAFYPTIGLLGLEFFISVSYAVYQSLKAKVTGGLKERLAIRSLLVFFFLFQPVARLYGRLEFGLTPWRSWKTSRKTHKLPVSESQAFKSV